MLPVIRSLDSGVAAGFCLLVATMDMHAHLPSFSACLSCDHPKPPSSAHQSEQEVHGAGMVIGWGATHPWLCGRPLLPDGKGRPTGSVHHVVVVSHHHERHPG